MAQVNMIVCCKQVPDPEAPPAVFKVDTAANKMTLPPDAKPIISPYDENAMEAALRIKEKAGGYVEYPRIIARAAGLAAQMIIEQPEKK